MLTKLIVQFQNWSLPTLLGRAISLKVQLWGMARRYQSRNTLRGLTIHSNVARFQTFSNLKNFGQMIGRWWNLYFYVAENAYKHKSGFLKPCSKGPSSAFTTELWCAIKHLAAGYSRLLYCSIYLNTTLVNTWFVFIPFSMWMQC